MICLTDGACDDCLGNGPCVGGFCTVGGAACTGVFTDVCVDPNDNCKDGGCIESSNSRVPPTTIVYCPDNIPTLSQWGLILFGMLLLTAMFVVIRRRGLPPHMTASLLVLGAVGLAVATAAYAQIQSERVCGESDIAVEFVNDLLNS
jgi:hypothetical protein